MKLTKQQVQHVANLARLGLTAAEIEKFQVQLSSILDYVELLNEVNTDGVSPIRQITGLSSVARPDELRKVSSPEKLLSCSPLPIQRNQIKVKPVFE